MRAVRLLTGAAGVAAVLFGVVTLADDPFADLRATAVWLAAGVLAHDGVLAPLVVLLGVLTLSRLPRPARAPAVVAAVVVGTVTLAGLPVLLRRGAKPDDPWLLPHRPWEWLVVVLVILAAVAAGAVLRARRAR